MTMPLRDSTREETPFSRWIRNNPRLDSVGRGMVNTDIDWLIHRYAVHEQKNYARRIQHIMIVEEKSRMARVNESQWDTLNFLNQAMRSADGKRWPSAMRRDRPYIRFWGVFVLQYSGPNLETSEQIWWHGKQITLQILEEVLLFHRSPRNPHSKDNPNRNHHPQWTGFLFQP